jgi:hypothetical protein
MGRTLNLSLITLKLRTTTLLLIVDLETIFKTEFSGMIMNSVYKISLA